MLSTLQSISSLFLSFSILCLGHGLLNTLVGIRAVLENYSNFEIGMMASAYFVGFMIGVTFCGRMIANVGHIRTFAATASLTSALAIAFILILSPLSWILFRFGYGICIASLYMVLESWLNLLSNSENRGKILSTYMVLNYASIAMAQLFFMLMKPDSFQLFVIVSILISISLVPLAISKKVQQVEIKFEHLPYSRIIQLSPVATISCLASGLTTGSIWGLCATFLIQIGFTEHKAALLISMSLLGALICQWPIGAISDRIDRRYMISICSLIAGLVALFSIWVLNPNQFFSSACLFFALGGFIYPIYSLSIALVNDLLETRHLIKASGSLLQFYALGAIIGPIFASTLMQFFDDTSFLLFLAITLLLTSIISLGITFAHKLTFQYREKFVAVPKTSIGAFKLDPRVDRQ